MSAYYSTLNGSNGNTTPGNFGISNAIRIGVQGNVPNYNIGINNAGLLQQSAAVNTQTNVMMGLLSGNSVNGIPPSALATSAQQAVTLIPSDVKFNGNELNPDRPRIIAYASETSFNFSQN